MDTILIANRFVVVKHSLITDVGSDKPVETDERHMLRISRPQITLIPGLIDVHIHALEGNTDSVEQSLRFGVTTVSDMHNEVEDIMRLKKVCAYFDDPRENCRRNLPCSAHALDASRRPQIRDPLI
jgi:dihydroorotase-like cyclic amidohydrolase